MSECSNRTSFCKVKCCECDFIGREEVCPHHSIDCGGDNVPSIGQWIKIYTELAAKRNEKTGMLDKETVRHILYALDEFTEVMGYTYDEKVSVITRRKLAEFCDKIDGKPVTKKSKCQKIGQAFARWVRYETDDRWSVPTISIPEIKDGVERFQMPPQHIVIDIARMYRDLYGKGGGMYRNKERLWLMHSLFYACRNGDINRMKWSNYQIIDGKPRLEYTPHKTSLSSKRKVKVWMNNLDYYDLCEYRSRQPKNGDDDFVFGGGQNIELQSRLNKLIRAVGVKGSKGIYLCRKLCTHAALKEHGKEHAEAISGDDYKTISKYYSDISEIDCASPKTVIG